MKSSRNRYEQYLQKLNDSLRRTRGADGKLRGRRHRSFGELVRAFVGLLSGHRRMLCLVLGAPGCHWRLVRQCLLCGGSALAGKLSVVPPGGRRTPALRDVGACLSCRCRELLGGAQPPLWISDKAIMAGKTVTQPADPTDDVSSHVPDSCRDLEDPQRDLPRIARDQTLMAQIESAVRSVRTRQDLHLGGWPISFARHRWASKWGRRSSTNSVRIVERREFECPHLTASLMRWATPSARPIKAVRAGLWTIMATGVAALPREVDETRMLPYNQYPALQVPTCGNRLICAREDTAGASCEIE